MSNNATVTIPYNEYQELLKNEVLRNELVKVVTSGTRETSHNPLKIQSMESYIVVSRDRVEGFLKDISGNDIKIK